MSKTNRASVRKLQRAKLATDLFLQGMSKTAIAEHLGIERNTVFGYIKNAEAEWNKESAQKIDTIKARKIAELQLIKQKAWEEFAKSSNEFKKVTTITRQDGCSTSVQTETRCADPRYLHMILQAVERECSILGLNTTAQGQQSSLGATNVIVHELSIAIQQQIESNPDLIERAKFAFSTIREPLQISHQSRHVIDVQNTGGTKQAELIENCDDDD